MEFNKLKKYFLLILFIFICGNRLFAQEWVNVQDSSIFSQWKDLVLEAKQEYAPDARSVYYQVYENKDQPGHYIIETSSKNINLFLERKKKELRNDIPFSVKLLPDTSLNGKIKGVINLSVANLRTKPGHSEEMATQSILGTPVDVLKKKGGYYLIRTPEGYLAWVDNYGISLKTEAEMAKWISTDKAIFIDDYGHSFKEQDGNSPRVSDLVLGNILLVLDKGKEYWKLGYPDGRVGFVPKTQVRDFKDWKANTKPEADHIIEVAKRMLGVPYLWGGTSIKGVDCSGFTKTSYFMNGVILPRDASQQATVGLGLDVMDEKGDLNVEKALKNLQKGDLIFFSGSKGRNPKQPVTHVAIYIENGEFIHAAGIVRINSFVPSAENYDEQTLTIVGARRYLGDVGFVPMNSVASTKGY